MRLLIAEDDAMLGAGLKRALVRAGYTVDWAHSGDEAISATRAQPCQYAPIRREKVRLLAAPEALLGCRGFLIGATTGSAVKLKGISRMSGYPTSKRPLSFSSYDSYYVSPTAPGRTADVAKAQWAFLAPDLQRQIFNGERPSAHTWPKKGPLPLAWSVQRALFEGRNAEIGAQETVH